MKKQSKMTMAGIFILLTVFVFPKFTVFADNVVRTIQVSYQNIKIYVDGNLVTSRDAAGRMIEPFIHDGVTYLPVRAISEALGKTVEWDEEGNSIYIGEHISEEFKEVIVSTAEELVNALGSNRRILLNEGVYNLSSVNPGMIYNSSVFVDEVFDGSEIRLEGVHNLTILGIGDTPSEIIIEPRYAYVLNFQNCSNINIGNIKAGHTESGDCVGGVFSFIHSSGITIDKALLYGCGTYGLNIDMVMDMKVTDSSIYECTYGAIVVFGGKDILFERCVFRNNAGFETVTVALTSGLTFDACAFIENTGASSYPMFSILHSDDVIVRNSTFNDNTTDRLIDSDIFIFDDSNMFFNNSF